MTYGLLLLCMYVRQTGLYDYSILAEGAPGGTGFLLKAFRSHLEALKDFPLPPVSLQLH